MCMWLKHIDSFMHAILNCLQDGATMEERKDVVNYVTLNIQFEDFSIFGFLDDMGFRTTVP